MAMQPALKDARANQAFESAMMPLRVARQRAIPSASNTSCATTRGPDRRADSAGRTQYEDRSDLPLDAGTALAAAAQITSVTLRPTFSFSPGWSA